jgi:hypothetical protein
MVNRTDILLAKSAMFERQAKRASTMDVSSFFSKLTDIANKSKLITDTLGKVEDDPILLIHSKHIESAPKLLIAAGFHGDEPAGCWGLLHYLEKFGLPEDVNVAILPMINPTGMRQNKHENKWNEKTNRGFLHDKPSPSREGRILLEVMDKVRPLANDGFLTLHEDKDRNQFYMYTFEHAPQPGAFTKSLVKIGSKHFPALPDNVIVKKDLGENPIDNIIFNEHDGSLEDYLSEDGVPRTACTETPGLLNFADRVKANADIMATFIDFHRKLKA